jgi:hypothetical protein
MLKSGNVRIVRILEVVIIVIVLPRDTQVSQKPQKCVCVTIFLALCQDVRSRDAAPVRGLPSPLLVIEKDIICIIQTLLLVTDEYLD